MDNTLTKSAPKSDAEYEAACAEVMAEIKQHEATFDKLHAEVVAMQETAKRKRARSAALTHEINRMVEKLWGTA